MGEKIKALRAAFPHTLPILTGYLALGAAYGVLLSTKGYGVVWALLTSTFIYAGSMQFVSVGMLGMGFHPLSACLMTLMVNARHFFYGIAMLDRLGGTGRLKPYLIFAMSDETFSLLCSSPPPEGVSRKWFLFFTALLDHSYWIAGSVAGGLLGGLVSFNTAGIDFVLTAMFVVIFINQWRPPPTICRCSSAWGPPCCAGSAGIGKVSDSCHDRHSGAGDPAAGAYRETG